MTPGAQHEEDRIHCRTVRHARVVTAQRVPWPGRQKRLHLCPECVRQAPAVIVNPPSGLPQSILLGHVLNMAMAALAAYWDRLLAEQGIHAVHRHASHRHASSRVNPSAAYAAIAAIFAAFKPTARPD